MSRVFISGSSDGLGLMAARLLVDGGHEVTLHARNTARAEDARRSVPQAKAVAVAVRGRAVFRKRNQHLVRCRWRLADRFGW
jgi:NAD(P)-dependent dehydrogenase (short-subunit alcohol dehydrogenase family)